MNRLALLAVILSFASIVQAQPTTVDGLTCESLADPQGIGTATPRFSWLLKSDRRNVRQSAYQVTVAENGATVWDSGRIKSDQSVLMPYGGSPLKSGHGYQWRVKAWDDQNTAAESSPASFSVGLLSQEDWTSKWIGRLGAANDGPNPPPAPLLRKRFGLGGTPIKRATAHVCALGYYELYLNGQKVGDHVLDPPITRFDKRALSITYDVTSQLKSGDNAIGLMLGSSWYNVATPDTWEFHKAPWLGIPQAMVQVDIEYADGTTARIISDRSWKGSTGPILFDQLRVCEVYDARLEKPNWSAADYDDTAWPPANEREGTPAVIVPFAGPPIRAFQLIRPVKMTEPKPGVYVFDLGQNIAGWERLSITGPAGTKVRMICGERLGTDGTVDLKDIHPGSFVKTRDFQTDTYTLRGGGPEAYEPRFTYHGFQYVQVEGLPDKPTLDTINGRVVHSDFAPIGTFECSNDTLNAIERATVWSYVSNFVGFPTDCPHREKNGWTGDAQLACRLGLEHFAAGPAYARWLNDFDDAQRDDGKLPSIVPTGGWGIKTLDGPAWESAYFILSREIHDQTGDDASLRSHYAGFKKWLDYYDRRAKGHIVTYGLGDWVPAKTKTPGEVTSTAYFYDDVRITAETARMLNNTADTEKYDALANDVAQAFREKFIDADGKVANGSQTAQSCALYFGLATAEQRPKVVTKLVEAVHAADDHIDTGILGSKYLLRALSDNGHADLAYKIAAQHTVPSWAYWLDHGGTTLWETWGDGASHNHIMFGDISAWFREYLAGIRVGEPGYHHFQIHPNVVGDLTSAKATHIGPYGEIVSSWKRVGDQLTLEVTVPPNSSAEVTVPTTDPASVRESNQVVKPTSEVGSGHYIFTATWRR